jgi:putative ABC transport system permease protein
MPLDVRFALRVLARNRTFTIAAVLSLALASAAATAGYAVANAVLWRPLPYLDSGRLVVVWETHAREGFTNRNEVSSGNFLDWRDRNHVFEHLTALAYRSLNLTGGGEPERLQAAAPSVDFFDMLGVQAAYGRVFLQEEESPSAAPVAVLSHGLWVRRFGASPSVVGSQVTLNGIATTIVGVLPRSFTFEFPTSRTIDIWVPRVVTPLARQSRRGRGLYVVGRLEPGVTIETAHAEMFQLAAQLAAEHPAENHGWRARVLSLQEQITGKVRWRVLLVFGAGLCVLLIACGNIAALQVANIAARRGELAIRAAIGAGQRRLLRQLLTEGLVLAGLGAVAGLALDWWLVRAVATARLAVDLPRSSELALDASVVGFAAIVALGAALVIGLVSARRGAARELSRILRHAPLQGTTHVLQQSLVVAAEVALAVMLLIGATLLVRSLARLENVDPGFDSHEVLTFELSLPTSQYATEERASRFYANLMERLRSVPGVRSAGAISNLPLGGSSGTVRFELDSREAAPPDADMESEFRAVTPDYFRTLGIDLRRGRVFGDADTAASPLVVIINQAMARRWWQGRDAIGGRLRFRAKDAWRTVVGVVGDVRHSALEAEPRPELYVPHAQLPNNYMYVAVRAAVPPETLSRAVAVQVHALDPHLPLYRVRPMRDLVDAALAGSRATTAVVGLFGFIAALLAAGGTYGVVSCVTGGRTREVGVRLALGAQRGQIIRLLLRDGVGAAGAGVVAGAIAGFNLARLMTSMLFGIAPDDPLTFVSVPLAMLVVTAAASALPAWRASRLDPVLVLKGE